MRVLVAVLLIVLSGVEVGVITTARVTVRYDKNERRLARSLSRRADKILTRLEERVGLIYPDRIEIILASSKDLFRKAQPGSTRVPDWAAAVAYPRLDLIVIKSPRAAPGQDLNLILAHEMTHLILGRIFHEGEIPVWLDEGLTMHLAGDWGLSRQIAMTRAVVSHRFIPLKQLAGGFPGDRIGAETAYAESFYFIAFLRNRYGRNTVSRLIQNLGLGVTLDSALLQATGQRNEELEDEFFRWLKLRFSIFPILTSSGVLWFLIALVVIIAWVKKKRAASRKMTYWEEEEEGRWQNPESF